MIVSTAAQRRELLRHIKTVAIVGASDNPARPSYFVLRYLKMHGYIVWPVNPAHELVDNDRCFPSLPALVGVHGPPDVADVFRRPDALGQVIEEVLASEIKTIWFQYGVINHAQIERADRAGLTVVVDRCMKVEHARFSRELSSQGFNSGIISAKRQPL